jgi:hypothetical protein
MNNIILAPTVINITALCEKILPLPKHTVLFGMAETKPVLFNVVKNDSPNTIVWDRIAGQGLRLIKTAIEFILRFYEGNRVEFVIMSNHTKEWSRLNDDGLGVWNSNECVAVVPFWDKVADQLLFGLSKWVQEKSLVKSPVILFIDGMENVDRMGEGSQLWLRHVMLYGRKQNIYVIGCARSENRETLTHWLEGFQAEIYGHEKIEWFEMDEQHDTILFFTPNTSI